MAEKITNKTIEESTSLIPYVIAEIAAEKAVTHAMQRELDNWKNLSKEQQANLDARYKKELQEVIDYLILRADTTFQYNADFNKKVKGSGNKGRDYLYMFMYHWVGIHEGYKTELSAYRRAMANYYKAMESYNKQKQN